MLVYIQHIGCLGAITIYTCFNNCWLHGNNQETGGNGEMARGFNEYKRLVKHRLVRKIVALHIITLQGGMIYFRFHVVVDLP